MPQMLEPTDNPSLPGESFGDYLQRLQSGVTTDQAQQAANDQAQRDQAATAKAYSSQGIASFTDSTGAIQAIKAVPGGPPLQGDGSNGGLVYGQDGSPQRVTFPSLDTPKLVDAYSPEGGGGTTTDKAGNVYAISPGAPQKWVGTDPTVQAQAQADTQDQQRKEQKGALDEASAVFGTQVSQAKQALANHQKALDANTAALQNIPELAGGDFDPDADDAATKLPAAFAPTDPQYNETVGFWGGGGRSVAAQSAREALAQRQQQAQALLAERQARQQAMDAVQDQHDTAQQRLDAVTQQRAALVKQRLQGDELDDGDNDFDRAQAAANAPAGTAGTAGTPDPSQTAAPAAPLAAGDSVLHTNPNTGITRPAVVRRVDPDSSAAVIRFADQDASAGDMDGRKIVPVAQLQRPAVDPSTQAAPAPDASAVNSQGQQPAAPAAPPVAGVPAPLARGDSVTYYPGDGPARTGTVLQTQPGMPYAIVRHDADPANGLPAQNVRVPVSLLQRPAADPTSTTPGQDASTTAAANDLTRPMPGESPDDFSARQASVRAAQAAATQAGQPSPTQPPAPKPYSVSPDGTLQLDPSQAPLGLLTAAKDGVISQEQAAQHLPAANQAQLALDTANQHAATNPGLSGQLKAFGGSLLQGITSGLGTIVRGPLGQGVAAAYDLATGNFDGLTKASGSPEERQAKAIGDAIQHSTDGFVDPSLKNTIGAKAGGFLGGVAPFAAAGTLGLPVLAATLFSSGYQSQYEAAKAKLTETAQQTGQPVDGDHIEAAAHTAGLLGGAINAVLALPVGRAVSAVARVFGSAAPSAISQGLVDAFAGNGAKGVLDTLADISSQGVGPEVQEALKAAAAQINKTIGARVLDVAKTAAKDSAVGAGAQVGQNLIAQQTYDPDRSLFEGVPEQAVGFGLMGAGTGLLREGTSAVEAAKGRIYGRRGNSPGSDDQNGSFTDGVPPTGPTPHPADLAKPVQGRVVSSDTTSPSVLAPSELPPDAPVQSPPASSSKTLPGSSSQASGPLASVPAAPAPFSSASQTLGQPANVPATGQAQPPAPVQDDRRQDGQASAPSAPAADPALTAMVQARDGARALLAQPYDPNRGTGVAPSAREATEGLVTHLNTQIEAAQFQQPAAQAGQQRPGQVPPGSTSPAPASTDASAPAAPAPTAPAGSPQPPRTSADAASPAPPATRPSQEITSAPSADGSTPTPASQSPAPTAFHQSLADSVNSGATSQIDGLPATPTFRALGMLRDGGATITPDLARRVDEQVQAIKNDPTLPDNTAKTAALKRMVAGIVPAEPHTDTGTDIAPANSATQTQGGSDLQQTNSTSSTAPATTDSAGSSLTVGDPVRLTNKAGNVVPATVQSISLGGDVQVKSRVGSATIPRAEIDSRPGRLVKVASSSTPASAPAVPSTPAAPFQRGDAVVVDGRPGTIQQIRPDQPVAVVSHPADPTGTGLPPEKVRVRVADLQRAPASSDVAPASPSAPPAPAGGAAPATRQPVTPQGIYAKKLIDTLTASQAAGRQISEHQQGALADARTALDTDLNSQVLGPNRQPTTVAGKRALANLQQMETYKATGMPLKPGDYDTAREMNRVLQNDFTAQRQAIEAQQQGSQAPALSQNEPAPPANSSPAAPSSPSAFKPRQAVVYKGRNAVVEHIDGDRAVVRALAGPDPKTGANLAATRFRNVPLSALRAKPAAALPTATEQPFTAAQALATAQAQINANRALLKGMGVTDVRYGPTVASSGVEIDGDGILKINAAKLANSMTAVRASRANLGTPGTAEEWFSQVLTHESIHAAQFALAHSKGMTLPSYYEHGLPDAAMPTGWQDAGRQVHGAQNWEAMPEWQRKAEFVRQVVENRWTGKITEALHRFIKEALNFLKGVAGFKDADPRFQAHVEEVEQRLGRAVNPDGTVAPRSFKMPTAASGYHDVLDHIAAEGGMVSQARARGRDTFTKYAGDYDGAPTLGGFYHHSVYSPESSMMPDQMAETLHQNYGVGDGSVDGMWKAIQQAVDSRRSVSARQKTLGDAQKQTDRFDRDAVESTTAKGAHAVNVAELNVGDHVTIGDQRLKVISVDPDNLDVTLEDHTKYGVQRVADNTALYVEKVEPAAGSEDAPLAAAAPAATAGLSEKANPLAKKRAAQLWARQGTDSPYFKQWFGDSKVVDAQGKPMVVYHGTQRPGFDRFRTGESLAYFAENPAYSQNFSLGKKNGTYQTYLNVRRPLDLTALGGGKMNSAAFGEHLRQAGINTDGLPYYAQGDPEQITRAPWQHVRWSSEMRERIRDAGYDGIKQIEDYADDPSYRDTPGNRTVAWAVFDPAQVKSAEPAGSPRSNSGAFDPGNPSMLAATRPDTQTGDLFGGSDDPFNLQSELASPAERVAAAKAQANRPPAAAAPTLRAGEKGTGDLFQGDDQPFNLAGETGIDHGARQTAREQAERTTAEATALQDRQQGSLFAPADSRLTYPESLFEKGSADNRKAQLLREAYATGELSHSPETGLWSRGPKTARVARQLVDANNERTLAEQRAILDGDKASLARNYAKAGNPKPLASLLTGREATLKAKEDALARFQAPADKSALSAAPTRDASGLTVSGSRNAWNSLGRAANGEKYAHLQPLVQAASPESASPADLGATYLRMLAQRRAGLPLTESGSRDTSALEQALDGPQPKMAEAALAKMPLAEPGAPAATQTTDPAGSLKDAAPDVRKALREKIAALRRAKQGVSPDLTHWLAKLDGRGSFMANLSPENESAAMSSLRALDQEHGLGLDLGATAPTTADPGLMAATDPAEASDPLTESLFGKGTPAPASAKKGNPLQRFRTDLAQRQAKGQLVDSLSAHHDAAATMANVSGRHAYSSVELDFARGQGMDAQNTAELDRQAAGPVVEAGGDRAKLAADLAKVQASPDKKLARQYAPIYQRALDNLPRLNAAADGYRQIDVREDAAAERAGLTPQWQARTKHLYDDPTSPESTIVPDKGFGATKGFKTAAEAINAGVDPKTTDLAALAQRRVERNRQAINEHAYQSGLASLKASDGKPLISSIQDSGTALNADGDPFGSAKVPVGYKAVQAGNNVLVAHKEIAPLLEAQYGESALRNNWFIKGALDVAALIKHGAVGVDTALGFQGVLRSLLGHGVLDYRPGLASLDFADADLPRAVAAGKITQAQADETRASRHIDEGLLREGLNVARSTDNLLESARAANLLDHVPVLGHAASYVNNLVFHQVLPGYMMQVAREMYAKNKARFPELSEQQLLRRSAKETNEFYGRLGTQGFLKSKAMQDVSKLLFFAPGYAEGRFRTEARGFAQAAKAPVDAVMGKGFRVGAVAQAMGGMILASLIGNQLINLATRGKPTWENEEEGHKWDAFIPGGKHGFFFSPFSIAADLSHNLVKYMDGGQNAVDALAHIVGNKLSGPARAVKDLVTGTDYRGQPYGSLGERLKASALEFSPLPMQAGALVSKDPKSALGYSLNKEPGSVEKQLFSSAGVKLENAPSARSQMYQIAQAFKKPGAAGGQHAPSEYSGLRQALDNQDRAGAQNEIRQLLRAGKSLPAIGKALGLHNGSAAEVQPEHFTGSAAGDRQMFVKLTPAQRATYQQAQRDRGASARLFAQWAPALLTSDPEVRRLAAVNLQQEQQARAASARSSAAAVTPTGVPLLSTPPRRRFNGGSMARSLLT